MAQTTGSLSTSAGQVEVSTNGSSWTDLGPALISTSYSGGEQLTGQQNTQDGAAPVVTHANKHAATQIDVTALYTETSAEAWETVKARWDGSAKTIYFRYSPKGGAGGDNLLTATDDAGTAFACPITSCLPPASDAGSGDPSRFSFGLLAPKLTESAVAT